MWRRKRPETKKTSKRALRREASAVLMLDPWLEITRENDCWYVREFPLEGGGAAHLIGRVAKRRRHYVPEGSWPTPRRGARTLPEAVTALVLAAHRSEINP